MCRPNWMESTPNNGCFTTFAPFLSVNVYFCMRIRIFSWKLCWYYYRVHTYWEIFYFTFYFSFRTYIACEYIYLRAKHYKHRIAIYICLSIIIFSSVSFCFHLKNGIIFICEFISFLPIAEFFYYIHLIFCLICANWGCKCAIFVIVRFRYLKW